VYGFAGDQPQTEASTLAPLTAYARSKVLAEQGLAHVADEGFRVTCLRFPTACGLSEQLRLDLVLNDFVAAAVAANAIRVLSDGTPWRPLIHVRDMARAIDWAVARDGDAFLTLNVGDDEANYQVWDLAEAVAKVLPGVEIWMNPEPAPDRRSYRVSFARFRELAPQHQPRCRLIDTIEELVEGLRRNGFSDPDFHTSKFIRLNVLANLRQRGLIDEHLAWTPAAREMVLRA
jgi:nucleoside-diphosphate-sugar epimerase